jgi:O-methyltransferase
MKRLKQQLKAALARVGTHLSDRQIVALNAVVNYVEVGWWVRHRGFAPRHVCSSREESFSIIAREVGHEAVLFLEFGVASGASIREWARLLSNPGSMLHGFDTFEGLPHDWHPTRPAGLFSQDGVAPAFDDERIVLYTGLFQNVLPSYIQPESERLIVHMDADLYSSTAFVLQALRSDFPVGSYILFDEFNFRADELRAFDEFLTATQWTFRMVCATKDFVHVGFKRVA